MLATLELQTTCPLPLVPGLEVLRVRSAQELRLALRRARDRSLAVDASGLDCVLRVDPEQGLVEVQACTCWASLAEHLGRHGTPLEAFATGPGLPRTVGEALAENAAGPDGVPLSSHVASITLATPDGELRRADRDTNSALFKLALGGQGVVGVLYSATLRLESLRRSAAQARAPVDLTIPDCGTAPAALCAAEYLLPPERLEAFLRSVRALATERRLALRGITIRRLLAEDETFLRWASREWAGVRIVFGIKPTLGAAAHAAEIRRLLLEQALQLGGSFPLRELAFASRAQVEACYPMLGAFLAEKRRGDPGERLQNGWFRCARAKLRAEACSAQA
jgi:FAD/FMN-containing dehydrogenase